MESSIIVIDGEELAAILTREAQPRPCLDLETGRIVPAEQCPPDQVGTGSPGVRAGRRYIEIPMLDEAHQEVRAEYDKMSEGEIDLVDDDLKPDYAIFQDELGSEIAAEEVAMSWIVSLRLPMPVGWFDAEFGVTKYHDPNKGWQDAM